jgi:putative phosphoesterase
MRIGIMSDTHGDTHNTRVAVRMFESLEIDLLIHCGDIGSMEVVSLLEPWQSHFVLGNMDPGNGLAKYIVEAGQTFHERFGQLEIDGRKIAFLHGDDTQLLQESIISQNWDLICFGHTHSATHFRQGQTLVVNPGAIRRTANPSVAIVDLPEMELTTVPLR